MEILKLEPKDQLTKVYHIPVLEGGAFFSYWLVIDPCPCSGAFIPNAKTAVLRLRNAGMARRDGQVIQNDARLYGIRPKGDLIFDERESGCW